MRVDPVKVTRFKRWLVPASALSLAVLAIGVLVIAEVGSRELARSEPRRGAPGRVGSPTPGVDSRGHHPNRIHAQAGGGGAPQVVNPLPAVARRPNQALNIPPPRREHSDPALAALHAAESLEARMQTLDTLISGLSSPEAVALLGRLLESRLPGTVYEERTLRLTVLARLGAQPGRTSEAILLRSTGSNRPRPERLIAIEFLSGRERARPRLQELANDDTDAVVQKKARWALSRGKTR